MKIFAVIFLAPFAVAAAFSGGAALSLLAGGAAVSLPQAAMLALARGRGAESAFSLWAGKFAATMLFLAAAAVLLRGAALLAAECFAAGAVLGVACNIAALARRPAEAN